MSLPILQRLLQRKIMLSSILPGNKFQKMFFSILNSGRYVSSSYIKECNASKFESICSPFLLLQNLSRGFKDKDVLTKRCKDCYFQRLDGRWFVFCNTHPRHKQRQRVDERNKWIITHSTHGVKKF